MVQGPRTKTRKGPSVHVDYIVHIQEIKPWPPSQSLKTIRAALIQWEQGEKNSGSTNQVVPSLDEGRIEFNESFRLNVTLTKEISAKNGNGVTFQKNCIEFNLYEPRRDKTGQLLGTAVVDLSEYGIARESLSLSAPINCKRTYGNTVQPLLFLKIEPVQKGRQSLRLRSEGSMDRSNSESFSALSEECAEEAEMDSLVTDDDVSSHSSLVVTSAAGESNGSSSPLTKEIGTTSANGNVGESKSDEEQVNESQAKSDSFHSSCSDSSFSSLDRSKRGKSVRSSPDSSRSNGRPFTGIHVPMADAEDHAQNLLSDSRIQHLENRIKNLEGELRESAAIEASLYSVVAEHGSSITKVHAPARRLSRLYFHDIKQNSKSRRGAAAKSIVSGLVLVSKACGNDVPRLTFWLSNSIVLRVIMSKSFRDDKLPVSVGAVFAKEGNGNRKTSPLKWESLSSRNMRNAIEERFGDWENPLTFVAALEKVEAWIFARIVESIWWQTFTPHMQSGNAKEIHSSVDSDSIKLFQRKSSSIDQQQGNFSLEHWKMAFRDACERICPLRAGGHDCGCLPVLSRVIMEQLVARLDVAMFNAILRESADEIPTDPVADPISDPEVLPIPSGKSSFGAGAQLKNAIGNWSRWLTDLFGIDDDDLLEDNEETACDDDEDDERPSQDTPSKCFRLLNALSDLMMLPKDLLLSRTVRKEVCPTFGAPIIRRVLNSFSPDEFCPDQIPVVVFEALNSEDPFESEDDSITNFPCAAAPISYQPPPAASVATILGDISNHPQLARSRSSVLRKSQTSDDELDELDSPLKSIILDSFQASPSSLKPGWTSRENGSRNALRYQLLRDVWMSCD